MFEELKPTSRISWNTALLLSFAAHALVLLVLMHRTPGSVLPHEVALGTPYSSGSVVYLAPLGRERAHDDSNPLQIAKVTAAKQDLNSRPKPVTRQREEASKTTDNAPDVTASAGSPYGVHIPGTPLTGPAVM